MQRIQWTRAAFALMAALAAAGGCDSEGGKSHDVTVSWNVGGLANTCEALVPGGATITFDKMVISVYDAEGDAEPIAEPNEVDCTDFAFTIPRLSNGTYFVTVEAMADYEGDYLPYYKATGTIEAPAAQEDGYVFTLLLNKGKLKVTWGFDDYGQCATHGVEQVEISLLPDPVDCALGEYEFPGLDWNSYSVEIDGLDADENVTWSGEYEKNPFEVKPGMDIEVLVILKPAG